VAWGADTTVRGSGNPQGLDRCRTAVCPASALVEVGDDHRLADSEPLRKTLEACCGAQTALNPGDVVGAIVRKTAEIRWRKEFLWKIGYKL
jgi:hypothetical protein